jgi:hypothetical protein
MTYWCDQVEQGEAYFLKSGSSLSLGLRDLLTHLLKAYGVEEEVPSQLDHIAVATCLRALVAPRGPFPQLVLYLDGLDELARPAEVEQLLPTKDLPKGVKLVVSSRYEPRFNNLEAAPNRVVVYLDDKQYDAINREEAQEFCDQNCPLILSQAERKDVVEAFHANFQLIKSYLEYVQAQHAAGKLDHATLQRELRQYRSDFSGTTGGEGAFHSFYAKTVWETAKILLPNPNDLSLLTKLAGYVAAAEGPVPLYLLAEWTGLEGEDSVEAAVQPIRRHLIEGSFPGPRNTSHRSYEFGHKTLLTFFHSTFGPLANSKLVEKYRAQIVDYYRAKQIATWDYFGLSAFPKLALAEQPELALETVTKGEFVNAVAMATNASGHGLGVDGLRALLNRVRAAFA